VASHGIGNSIEASLDFEEDSEGDLKAWRERMGDVVEAYKEAVGFGGYNEGEVLFHLAVALEVSGLICRKIINSFVRLSQFIFVLNLSPKLRLLFIHNKHVIHNNKLLYTTNASHMTTTQRLGESSEAEEIMSTLRRGESNLSCLVDSWGYVRWHTRRTAPPLLNLHRGTRAMLQIALDAAQPLLQHDDGLICEFGVASGRSLRMTQEMLPLDVEIHGFDTFTGLPVAWGNEPAGTYSTGGAIPKMEGENVHFHQGLFKDTIPSFLTTVDKGRPLAYANIDCDLYGSTRDVLEACHGRIIPGTVLVFDEYLCHPSWRQDEFRCWRECCKRFGWQYEYLAFSLSTKQAVVRVTS
jgi:hypothetical protein